jgi:N-acyl-D-aspartate/D-glutamate deacylase
MEYDLLIRNGRIIDGSGAPAYRGDVGVRNGKIAATGKLSGNAKRTIDANGMAVTPGFVDTHCHYDAQVTWDPLCTFSCHHGVTSVIIGNCSLALAPVRPGGQERLAEFLSYVEAIPMETLRTMEVSWETIPQYMDALDQRLGVNVGNLIGHTPVRHYVMGADSQSREATPDELEAMRAIVREAMNAGALGLSLSKVGGHYDPQGVRIPALWADEKELFALADVLAELGTGIIQAGGGRVPEEQTRLMSRLSEATGRQVVYSNICYLAKDPDGWKRQMAHVDETIKAGIRCNPMASPNRTTYRFTMRNSQVFRGVPTWHPILIAPDEEKLAAYRDPEIRRKLHHEVVEWTAPPSNPMVGPKWMDTIWVDQAMLPKNKPYEGKSLRQLADLQGKGVIDAFLDLVVEENLDTAFVLDAQNTDLDIMGKILTYPNAYIGLSDGGAHVQFRGGTDYSTQLLGYWVRERGIMPIEHAVKQLTFDSASVFGIYDRGLLRPGLAADIAIFDPDTIRPLPVDKVFDLPAGAWRLRELPAGVFYTIVNGEVLVENGAPTGALPGRVLRNTLYRDRAG